jgi:hypothetical protein
MIIIQIYLFFVLLYFLYQGIKWLPKIVSHPFKLFGKSIENLNRTISAFEKEKYNNYSKKEKFLACFELIIQIICWTIIVLLLYSLF